MKSLVQKFWKNEFIRGGAFVTISFTIANVLNYFFTFLAGKLLGPAGYGEIAALFSYVNIISVPITVVIMVITQKISSADENAPTVAWAINSYLWKTVRRFWYLIAFSFLIIPLLPRLTNLEPVTALFFLPVLLGSFLFLFYSAVLQGTLFFLPFAFITVLSPAIKLSGPFIGQFLPGSLPVVLTFLFLSFAVPSLVAYILYIPQIHKKRSLSASSIERSLLHIITEKQFLITTASILGLTLLNNLDIIFAKKYFSGQQAGLYSSWSLFAKIILYAVGPLSSISFVFFSSKKNMSNHERGLFISILFLAITAAGSYVFYSFFAGSIITMLFGTKFYAVVPYLAMASIYGSLYSTIAFLNNYFLAKKSPAALILPICMPIYILWLLTGTHLISDIMRINIYFSLGVMCLCALAYFRYRQR